MPIRFKEAKIENSGPIKAVYEVEGSQPGRDGVTVTQDMELKICINGTRGSLTIGNVEGKSPEEAVQRLALHCELVAKALRHHEHNVQVFIPVW